MKGVVWWRRERWVSAPGDFERGTRPSVETSLRLEGEEEEIGWKVPKRRQPPERGGQDGRGR